MRIVTWGVRANAGVEDVDVDDVRIRSASRWRSSTDGQTTNSRSLAG